MEIRIRDLILNAAREFKLKRLKQPYSMLAPKPLHFPQFSKLEGTGHAADTVQVSGLDMDALYDTYGMPRDVPQMILTVPGVRYGQEFADFTVEMFGVRGDVDQPDEIGRLAERTIADNMIVAKADPDTLPFGAGGTYILEERKTGKCLIKIHIWRLRVFLNNSSLCLENNWHRNDLIGGSWIPFILGIVYDNPEKMVADTIRFAPAFRLCNLVEAAFSRPGRPERYVNKEEFLADLEQAAAQLEIDGNDLTQLNIAELLEADERQIRLWYKKFEMSWSTWKQERTAKPDKNQK